jgi:hypothetical protein
MVFSIHGELTSHCCGTYCRLSCNAERECFPATAAVLCNSNTACTLQQWLRRASHCSVSNDTGGNIAAGLNHAPSIHLGSTAACILDYSSQRVCGHLHQCLSTNRGAWLWVGGRGHPCCDSYREDAALSATFMLLGVALNLRAFAVWRIQLCAAQPAVTGPCTYWARSSQVAFCLATLDLPWS